MGIPSLEIGKRAVMAQKFGLDVTSNNIANVNTPGYSRRTAILAEGEPVNSSGHFIGTGSLVEKLQSFRNEFIDKEITTTNSRLEKYKSDIEFYQRIEANIAEPSELGINELSSKFFNLFNELSIKPEDLALRDHVIEQARSISERFNAMAADFSSTREDALKKLDQSVTTSNNIISQIANYNSLISNSDAAAISEAQTYIDERQVLIEELSAEMNISIANDNNGVINVFTEGINLVTGTVSNKLELRGTVNPATSERTVQIVKIDSKNNNLTELNPSAGRASSLANMYNIVLDDIDSSGDFSVVTEFNSYVKALADNVNELTSQGYGLDDSNLDTPPGRFLFLLADGNISAASIQLNPEIIARNLPLSDSAGDDGNSEISRAIARIQNNQTFLNGASPSQFYSAFISKIGVKASEADNGEKTLNLIYDQLDSQRESIQGVNLDEEAVNLIKFQKAFEAASRVINITNEMLNVIVNLGR